MLARQCDRCGKYMPEETRNQQELLMLKDSNTAVDLCMDCYSQIAKWMKDQAPLPLMRINRVLQFMGSETYHNHLNSISDTKEAAFCAGLSTGALLMLQDSYGGDSVDE